MVSTSDNPSRSPFITAVLLAGIVLASVAAFQLRAASAASCVAPSTDYGNVSNLTMGVASTGTYRLWTRLAAADTVNNSVMVEVDGANCYTIGGSSVPVYGGGATTYFSNDTSNWVGSTSGGTAVNLNLTAGSHMFTLVGVAPGVIVDRLVLASAGCTPTGNGDNCATATDSVPPTVAITAPANNASVSGVITVTTTATDNIGVSKVELYVDGVLKGTDTVTPYSFSLDTSTLATGTHTLVAKAYDTGANVTSSSPITVTVAGGVTYLAADINQDGTVNIQDFGLLKAKFSQTGSGLGRADINQDGVVNIQDFGLLRNSFGQHS